jgi:hypothetical protein
MSQKEIEVNDEPPLKWLRRKRRRHVRSDGSVFLPGRGDGRADYCFLPMHIQAVGGRSFCPELPDMSVYFLGD